MARKKANIHYLYKTTCIITGKYYIGMHSTSNMDDGYMGSGKRLRYSIRKYGKDNHIREILEFFEDRDLLIEAEIKSITPEMISDKNCMNLKEGGYGGGGFWNEEHREKFMLASSKTRINILLENDYELKEKVKNITSKRITELHKNGYFKYDKFKNKNHSEESKEKMSKKAKERVGDKNSQYGTCWITKDGINKKIKKDGLDSYLNEGWVKGRKI